jgi:hypothetical protein
LNKQQGLCLNQMVSANMQRGVSSLSDHKHLCVVRRVDDSFGRASRHHVDRDVEPVTLVLGKHLRQIPACRR